MNTSIFDSEFQEKGLTWLPWIGKHFLESKYKFMVWGESFYLWAYKAEFKNKLENNNYCREFINGYVLKREKDLDYNIRVTKNLERAIFQKSKPKDEQCMKFWENVCYNVIVQRYMPSLDKRPTNLDYLNGWKLFFKVQKILKPDCCLFLGVEASNTLKNAMHENGCSFIEDIKLHKKVGRTFPRTALIKQGEIETKLIFIRHSSAHFSWEKWGNFINQQLPNIICDLI